MAAVRKRTKGSGATVRLNVRVSAPGMAYIDERATAHGLDRSDYVRGLLAAEAKVNKAGRSLFIEGYKP